jgi:hypothetical protein
MRYWDVFLGSHFLGCVEAETEKEAKKVAIFKYCYRSVTLKEIKTKPMI